MFTERSSFSPPPPSRSRRREEPQNRSPLTSYLTPVYLDFQTLSGGATGGRSQNTDTFVSSGARLSDSDSDDQTTVLRPQNTSPESHMFPDHNKPSTNFFSSFRPSRELSRGRGRVGAHLIPTHLDFQTRPSDSDSDDDNSLSRFRRSGEPSNGRGRTGAHLIPVPLHLRPSPPLDTIAIGDRLYNVNVNTVVFSDSDELPEPEPIPLNHPESSQAASSSNARPVSSQALSKTAHILLQYLENGTSLADAPPEVRKSMSYQTSQEVARQLRAEIKENRHAKAGVLNSLETQYQIAQPSPGKPDKERETRLFWNQVSQQVFGKTVPEIMNKAPMGFNAVIGMEKEKKELMDYVVRPLNRFKQQEQGFKLAQAAGEWDDPDAHREEQPMGGVLLYGKPGTGKSWLARRLAEELDMQPIVMDRASIIASPVGDAEKNLKAAFAQAAKQKPSVLIVEQIDSLLRKKDSQLPIHEYRLTNQMLHELEEASQRGVLVVGTTNRIHEIDSGALKRPGRFSNILKMPETTDGPPTLVSSGEGRWQARWKKFAQGALLVLGGIAAGVLAGQKNFGWIRTWFPSAGSPP